ncbi:MAG: ACP S-malonyltransferase [Clostridiales bacterium]|nr:ACP S-malonyltransferase [Clostridiales bacterium]
MGKIAFLFSGQGAQHVGMGKDLYDHFDEVRALFDEAEALRPGTLEQCFSGDEETLRQTRNTQPCLYLADLAAAVALKSSGIVPDAVAGFSLGEIPALAFAGACSYMEGFQAAVRRGEAMETASRKNPASMLAVVKLDNRTVEEICGRYAELYPVNYNCAGQLVVSGKPEVFDAFSADIKAAGGRTLPLKVSGGFHSPFMDEASREFGEYLKGVSLRQPEITAYSNYTAKPYEGDMAELLTKQINHPVHWESIVQGLLADGFDTFVEAGVGSVLQKLCLKIAADVSGVRCLKCETADEVQAAAEDLK